MVSWLSAFLLEIAACFYQHLVLKGVVADVNSDWRAGHVAAQRGLIDRCRRWGRTDLSAEQVGDAGALFVEFSKRFIHH